jgi:arylsulfatase A
MFWHLQKSRPIVAMRDGDFSLVANPNYEIPATNMFQERWIPRVKNGGYKDFQLFDLSKDPGQTQNIASDNPELLKNLKAKLLQINQSVMADGTDWHLQ